MTPTPTNDTGIVGDQNTNISEPSFIGQVYAPFPGTVADLQVYIEFDGLHNGVITLRRSVPAAADSRAPTTWS